MTNNSTQKRKDGGGAPLQARPRRGQGDKIDGKPGGKPGEKIPPSAIHTVARDVLLPYQVR
jgi:hypothetical protein